MIGVYAAYAYPTFELFQSCAVVPNREQKPLKAEAGAHVRKSPPLSHALRRGAGPDGLVVNLEWNRNGSPCVHLCCRLCALEKIRLALLRTRREEVAG